MKYDSRKLTIYEQWVLRNELGDYDYSTITVCYNSKVDDYSISGILTMQVEMRDISATLSKYRKPHKPTLWEMSPLMAKFKLPPRNFEVSLNINGEYVLHTLEV